MSRDLRYPIGLFEHEGPVHDDQRSAWIEDIAALPQMVRRAVEDLDDEQLDTPYRLDGWTVRQVVHHLADSHLNAYLRFKWVLTENEPVIRTYDEAAWAELSDYRDVPVATTLDFLDHLVARWIGLLRRLTPGQLARRFDHPEIGPGRLDWYIGNYAWHGRHHVAHVTSLRERMGW